MMIPELDGATLTLGESQATVSEGGGRSVPGLTILWHPDVDRVGERLTLTRGATDVARLEPAFSSAGGRVVDALADPYVSRKPVRFERLADERIRVQGAATADGANCEGGLLLSVAAVEHGVVIELGRRILLLLHQMPSGPCAAPRFGLVGESAAMRALRQGIERVAPSRGSVMIRGESGSGKELVARAVHEASTRADGPYRAVNVAAVPATVAVSAFFGHTRGAFSGADRAKTGYFGESDGGTLFLDEVGELPGELQPMLLRALESGDIQPVGATRARMVDVRIVAATDADLDDAIASGRLSVPLKHRLTNLELWVPPLRSRVDDIPRLLLFGLRRELAALGAQDLLTADRAARRPWLDARTVGLMVRHRWPGNVRELLNVARQIAVVAHDQPRVSVSAVPALQRMRAARRDEAAPPSTSPTATPSAAIDEDAALDEARVVDVLRAQGWSVHAAARALGTPKTTLYRFIEAHGLLRKAAHIPDDELRAVYADCRGDRSAMSDRLRISTRALTFRLKALDPPV